ncbi:MAG: 2,3-bisphosphoglycerate-independent phosphoglycerate mutase [Pseudomonadota bacterium]
MDGKNGTVMKSCTALIILDGWGHNEPAPDNAIASANTPTWDRMWRDNPNTLVLSSGNDVGLPGGQMGNSEVGHMNLGAGRVVHQDLTRIDADIDAGRFAANPAFTEAFKQLAASGGALHLMGLLSPGGVHSHEDQINAFIEAAYAIGLREVYLHAFLDGRDTPPRSARPSLERTSALFERLGNGRIASLCGRYFAMDRDNRWDRVERAWQMLVEGEAPHTETSAVAGLEAAYQRDENDEFVAPTLITPPGSSAAKIGDGDAVVFLNFRADRARQLSAAFRAPAFDGFACKRPELASFVTLTQYTDDLPVSVAYPPIDLVNTLGEHLETLGKTQLRIAETEKYAHVTFFFSGGREAPFDGEERILVPSPDVATYDLKPEMSAVEMTDELVAAIRSGRFDTIICNFANGDMVGHTGVFDAAVTACETVDVCLARITAALDESGGQCLITADHGNVEQMHDDANDQPHTQHTTTPVPLIYHGPDRDLRLDAGGSLSDIAPTLLHLMDLPQPAEMSGRSLAQRPARQRSA